MLGSPQLGGRAGRGQLATESAPLPREPGRDPAGLTQGKKGPGRRLCGPRGEGLVCREA